MNNQKVLRLPALVKEDLINSIWSLPLYDS